MLVRKIFRFFLQNFFEKFTHTFFKSEAVSNLKRIIKLQNRTIFINFKKFQNGIQKSKKLNHDKKVRIFANLIIPPHSLSNIVSLIRKQFGL